MKLWIFGDSYAVHLPRFSWTWIERVKSVTGAADAVSCAVYGAALHWTYHCFETKRSLISPGDVVVVMLTSLDRRWFFPDIPYISNAIGVDASGTVDIISSGQKRAVLAYYTHLHHQEQEVLQLVNWLDMLDLVVRDLVIRCLVIPAFPDSRNIIEASELAWSEFSIRNGMSTRLTDPARTMSGTQRWHNIDFARGGDLYSIYQNEFTTLGMPAPGMDLRENHLCRDNHEVLAQKISAWITRAEPVILTGFHERVITEKVLDLEGWYHKNIVGV